MYARTEQRVSAHREISRFPTVPVGHCVRHKYQIVVRKKSFGRPLSRCERNHHLKFEHIVWNISTPCRFVSEFMYYN